jgi:allantoicase
LGSPARRGVSRIVLDTRHFRGNYPESVEVHGCWIGGAGAGGASGQDSEAEEEARLRLEAGWFPLVARCRMSPDSEHVFDAGLGQISPGGAGRPVTHVRVSIYPDGGLSRVRVYGEAEGDGEADEEPPEATGDGPAASQ